MFANIMEEILINYANDGIRSSPSARACMNEAKTYKVLKKSTNCF